MIPLVFQSTAETSQSAFLGWPLVAWTVLPFLLMMWLARRRKRVDPEPPHVNDQTFGELVLRSERPVLVHFYRSWSIGDRVMVNMAKRIAQRNAERAETFWLDVDANPETMARFPNLTTPAFVFFVGGKRVFHSEGVVDEADVVREMWMAEEAERARRSRAPGTTPEG